jgi:hypothetical protein
MAAWASYTNAPRSFRLGVALLFVLPLREKYNADGQSDPEQHV